MSEAQPNPRKNRKPKVASADLPAPVGPRTPEEEALVTAWKDSPRIGRPPKFERGPNGKMQYMSPDKDLASARLDQVFCAVDRDHSVKPPDAKKLAREIMENGTVRFSRHALEEMAKDDLHTTDCLNLLRAGAYQPPEYINQEWRYRVETPRICVVATFESDTRLCVVTAWRNEK